MMATFKEAFREARAAGDKTFMWNGKKYTTELAKPKAGVSRDMPSKPSGGGMDEDRRFARQAGISSDMPSRPSGGGMDEDRTAEIETPPMSANQRMAAAREKARNSTTGTDRRSVTERMGGKEESGSVTERMKRAREKARGESKTGTDTRSVSERIKSALGLKKGGNVKSYAKGGSVRGAGIAQRGVKACKTY